MLDYLSLDNGEKIAYRKRNGGSQILVLIHGNMASSLHWDTLMESLSPELTIYAFDLRGFGHSSYKHSFDSISELSRDIEECIQILDLKDVVVAGWSLGGPVVMDLCLHDIENRIRACILICSASTKGFPYFSNTHNRLVKKKKDLETDTAVRTLHFLQRSNNLFGIRSIWDNSIYTTNKPEPIRYLNYLNATAQQRNIVDANFALHNFYISDKIPEINVPVSIIYGENDRVVSKSMTQQIIDDFGAKASVFPFENSGHSPMTDELDKLTSVIESISLAQKKEAL